MKKAVINIYFVDIQGGGDRIMKETLKIDESTKMHKNGTKSQDEAKKYLVNEVNRHRKKIIEMTNQIEDEKFLKRICISLEEYLKEYRL